VGVTITGSDAQINRWINGLNSTPGLMKQVSHSMAEETITLVSQGFRKQQDPYGGKWASRKSGGGGAILVDTGALRNSFHVSGVGSSGFTVSSGVAYSEYHQSGTSRMVARRMVPDSGDIPGKWSKAYDEIVEDVLDDHLGE